MRGRLLAGHRGSRPCRVRPVASRVTYWTRLRLEPLEDRRMLSVFAVNSLADVVAADGLVTLREALQAANTNTAVYDAPAGSATETDVITFAPSLFTDGTHPVPRTITLGGTQLQITDTAAGTNIQGPGDDLLTIDANDRSRVFYVGAGVVASISDVTITGGWARNVDPTTSACTSGGGVYNLGVLTMARCTVADNAGEDDLSFGEPFFSYGGGIWSSGTLSLLDSHVKDNSATFGGGFWSAGTSIVMDSRFEGNLASTEGGGLYGNGVIIHSSIVGNSSRGRGGGLYWSGSITDTDITQNYSGTDGGGVYGSGTITNSTISDNWAESYGGGISSRDGSTVSIAGCDVFNNHAGLCGGGIYTTSISSGYSAKLTITGSTISGNTASEGAGIYKYYRQDGEFRATNCMILGNVADEAGGGILAYEGRTWLTNTTVMGNSAPIGGGIHSEAEPWVVVTNSMVAMNEATVSSPDILWDGSGLQAPSGFNLIGVWDEVTAPGANSIWGTSAAPLDPGITFITDESGSFLFYHLDPDSPAVNAGSNALAVDQNGHPLTTDVLGNARIYNGTVDIGAVEFSGELELVVTPTPDVELLEGESAAIAVSLSVAPAAPVTVTVMKALGGSDDITADRATLQFDASNWNVAQTVVLSAADDADLLNDDSAVFTFSAEGMDSIRIFVSVTDDDTRTYVVDSLADTVAVDGLLTLREALEAGNSNAPVGDALGGSDVYPDLITFAPELAGRTIALSGTQLEILDDTDVRGLGAGVLTIDARGASRVFYVGQNVTVTIDGLTITRGSVSNTDPDSDEEDNGGGIYFDEYDTATITNSVLVDNEANQNGGGVYSADSGTLTLLACTLQNNRAGNNGGGIYQRFGDLTVSHSTITGCSAVGSGGGICLQGSDATINDSLIEDNTASGGGGVSCLDTVLVVDTSVFLENVATAGSGGGISSRVDMRGNMRVVNSTLSGNTAVYGGALYCYGSSLISNSTVTDNVATNGGGCYNSYVMQWTSVMTVVDSVFRHNHADNGGAIYSQDDLVITGSNLAGNAASQLGGGVYAEADTKLLNSTLARNTAAEGGAIYENGPTAIVDSTIALNAATGSGGGIYGKWTITATNSTVVHNTANQGGGICGGTVSSRTLKITNSIVAMNEAATLAPDVFLNKFSLASTSDYNLIGAWDSATGPGAHSLWGTSTAPLVLQFVAVTNEDGDVLYYRPYPDSPAIDAGSNALAVDTNGNPLTTDMVGNDRIINGTVDIGAIEVTSATELIVAPTPAVELLEGESAAISVMLSAAPADSVVVTIAKREGDSDMIVYGPTGLQFDATNWSTPQTVVVTAFRDSDAEDETALLSFSSEGMVTVRVSVLVNDYRTYVVDSLADVVAADGHVTLREAIQAANTNTAVGDVPAGRADRKDIITFAPGLAGGTIVLGGTVLQVLDDLEIRGLGAGALAIDANKRSRVFSIGANVEASLSGVTLTGGKYADGAAIYNPAGGALALADVVLSGNAATNRGGGVYNLGTLTISGSTVSANSASTGAGIYNASALACDQSIFSANISSSYGGGIYNAAGVTTTVTDSTFEANSAASRGGGIYNSGTLNVDGSTFLQNKSTSGMGGALCCYDHATATVVNSIVQGNSAQYGGGLLGTAYSALKVANTVVVGNYASKWGGGLFSHGSSTLSVTNTTVADNVAGEVGGGIYSYSNCTLYVKNSIAAMNSAPSSPEIYGTLHATSSHNLVGGDPGFVRDPSQGLDGTWGTADDDYGDLRLVLTSPAINAGSNALAVYPDGSPLVVDLDGNPRIVSGVVDIGAYECQSVFYVVDSLADTVADDGLLTLREALQASNTNAVLWDGDVLAGSATATDVITFAPALFTNGANPVLGQITLSGTQLEILDEVEIWGPGPELLAIDADGLSRAFYVGEGVKASLSDLTITSGYTSGEGGGICNLGDLCLTDLIVSGNLAGNGGGIASRAGFLTVTASTFSGNSAQYAGGGICIVAGAAALAECAILDNSAEAWGGGIASTADTLTIVGSTISRNTSRYSGGGGMVTTGDVSIARSTFSANSAYRGGGIYNFHDGTMTLASSAITGNSASRDGGGVYSDAGSTMFIADSTFSTNIADNQGGGICNLGTLDVATSTISDNGSVQGGGICNLDTLHMAASIVSGNEATEGGGVYNGRDYGSGGLSIENSTISGNLARNGGGGVSNYWPGMVTIEHSTISANSAQWGGGVSGGGLTLTIRGCTISGNSATGGTHGYGGGVLAGRGEVYVSDSTITANSAAMAGGGIAADRVVLSVANSCFDGNSAMSGGGLYAVGSTGTVVNTLVVGNVAEGNGGGVRIAQGELHVADSTISGNVAGQSGGGVHNDQGILNLNSTTIADNEAHDGAGISTDDGTVAIAGCRLLVNSAVQFGGGVYSHGAGTFTLDSSTIAGNSAAAGGGLYTDESTATITNSILVGNVAAGNGGGILATVSTLRVTNSDVVANVAGAKGGGIHAAGSTLVLANAIVALNQAASSFDLYGILGPGSGAVLLGTDPSFLRNPSPGGDGVWGTPDDDYGNLRLQGDSLAINSGSNALAVDAQGDSLDVDFDGDPRIVYGTVDIGAYEFRLVADADADGTVDRLDAAILAAHWGMSGLTWSDGDFNGDGLVNAADASIMAANWGQGVTENVGEDMFDATVPVAPVDAPSVGPMLVHPTGASRQQLMRASRTEGTGVALLAKPASERTAAATDAALIEGYGPQREQPTLDRECLAWSYTLTQRPSHERANKVLDPTALAVNLLLADQ
jgi:fibronectin-binding autotransporter adhesin